MTQTPDYVYLDGQKLTATDNGNDGTKTLQVCGQYTAVAGFSDVGASVIDLFFVQPGQVGGPVVGTGVGYSQASGSIAITSGTTANAEFLARSVEVFNTTVRLRHTTILSQRIVNNNFHVLLADLIGERLSYTINSAVSVTVSLPGHNFTALNVGQFVFLGGITGAAGVPGRYAIASVVAGVSITFTVASWPATGTGALTLFGRNHVKALYTGTTATNVAFDVQRNGWATGDTTATINTTASPGTLINIDQNGREVYLSDTLRASSTTPNYVSRASRAENIPDPTIPMYVFLWSYNGTTAPASTTTWTLGHLAVEPFTSIPVFIEGNRIAGSVTPLPVALQTSTASIGSIGTITSSQTATGITRADVASAVISSTTTTAAFTPIAGMTYEVNIPVTAISGTPTLDVNVEESDDSGTNWYVVYSFPRISATGMYRSPKLSLQGNRVRYVQTLTGTTSFTRAINRLEQFDDVTSIRQLIDRTIVLTTLNSVTPSLNVQNCQSYQLVFNVGAATTPAQIILEGSDDNGATWYAISGNLTAVASSTVQITVSDRQSQLIRARVAVVGVTITAGYVLIKGF